MDVKKGRVEDKLRTREFRILGFCRVSTWTALRKEEMTQTRLETEQEEEREEEEKDEEENTQENGGTGNRMRVGSLLSCLL